MGPFGAALASAPGPFGLCTSKLSGEKGVPAPSDMDGLGDTDFRSGGFRLTTVARTLSGCGAGCDVDRGLSEDDSKARTGNCMLYEFLGGAEDGAD